jgi:hypothetical protein
LHRLLLSFDDLFGMVPEPHPQNLLFNSLAHLAESRMVYSKMTMAPKTPKAGSQISKSKYQKFSEAKSHQLTERPFNLNNLSHLKSLNKSCKAADSCKFTANTCMGFVVEDEGEVNLNFIKGPSDLL